MVAQDIRDVTRRFAEAFNRGDLDAAVEFYTDDATFLHPNVEIVSGKQAIKEFFEAGRAFLGLKTLDFKILESDYDGNLAYERGIIQIYMEPEGGQPLVDKGKYLVVMKRGADGLWKVAVDIWNSDLPQPVPK
jgi:uncharacterized protein (TIGR02246 family)